MESHRVFDRQRSVRNPKRYESFETDMTRKQADLPSNPLEPPGVDDGQVSDRDAHLTPEQRILKTQAIDAAAVAFVRAQRNLAHRRAAAALTDAARPEGAAGR
ncbi:hypothetical protein GCM10009827_084190 [Dactylosporangium maewongense]|uniref:Uncharacterized protein n=1 Tax=Dactylosporangium maewongense TaxID=634393 RepID=A0ABN2C330_9ACTN